MLRKISTCIFISLISISIIYAQTDLPDTRHFGDGFVVNQTLSGLPLHWAGGTMEYHISESVPNRFRDPVKAGFDSWHLHPDINTLIHSEFKGLTSSNNWGGPADGINNVVYISRNWTARTGASTEFVALTRIRYNALTGRITDADIAINADHHRLSHAPPPPPNHHDMHSIIAHEVGHVWGLSDLIPPGEPGHHEDMGDDNFNKLQTMYFAFETGDIIKQTIDDGDIAGIKYIYKDNLPFLNVDIVLVYDRSVNFNVKYNALTQSKNRGEELVDQLRIGDRIGVVQFPEDVLIDLTEIDISTDRSALQDIIAGIEPDGNVTVGSGLLKAEDILAGANSPNNLQAIILFSSGEEDSPPWVVDEIDKITFPVYTIGFEGSPGQTTLNMISDATGGEFFQIPDFTHIADAVNQIWTHLSSQLTIFADGGMTGDITDDPWQTEIIVDADAEIIQPGIVWLGSDLDLCLITPSGNEICPENNNFEYIKGPTYAFYNINDPEIGKWGLKVIVNSADDQRFLGYMRAVGREFVMTAETDQIRYIVGDEIELIVTLIAGGHPLSGGHESFGNPIADATVVADVNFPDGTDGVIELDNHGNGIYTTTIPTDDFAGRYRFKVTASRGDDFTRERRLSAYVALSEIEFSIQSASTILNHMINFTANLDPVSDYFFEPAAERRNALINKLLATISKLMEGHIEFLEDGSTELFEEAYQKLQNDILPKVAGEWVKDSATQAYLVALVESVQNILLTIISPDPPMASWSDEQTIAVGNIPDRFDIFQNYPNPFNPVTTIRYQLPENLHVTLSVYNLLGQRVRTLVDDLQTAGYYTVQWDGTNQNGMTLSSGMYFYRIQAGSYNEVRKMLFMK